MQTLEQIKTELNKEEDIVHQLLKKILIELQAIKENTAK